MSEEPEVPSSVPSPAWTGMMGRCPRCAKGSMFKDWLALADSCRVCGLDFSFADTGDGPAFFASFIGGFLILGLGVWMQIALEPAWWVYVVVFIPLGFGICLALLRLTKGILVALQYTSKAGQGRFEP